MKTVYGITLLLLSVAIFSSCEKEDLNAKHLYRGEGRWIIDFIQYLNYDSTGATIFDSTLHNAGELVLFRSGSLEALYGYRQAIFLYTDTTGTHGYPFEYMYDGYRISLSDCGAPTPINGVYSSVIDKKSEQQWEMYSTVFETNNPNTMGGKTIIHLKKSK